jgi:hypothetical protein
VCGDRDLPRGGVGAEEEGGEEMAVSAKAPRDLRRREINCRVWSRMQTSCRPAGHHLPVQTLGRRFQISAVHGLFILLSVSTETLQCPTEMIKLCYSLFTSALTRRRINGTEGSFPGDIHLYLVTKLRMLAPQLHSQARLNSRMLN